MPARPSAAFLRFALLCALRGTGVLRWEYRPGSTLYFVWTQEREGSDQFGDFNFNRDRSALFPDRPTNIFQIKGTYWIDGRPRLLRCR
jgi:hypothetical protein